MRVGGAVGLDLLCAALGLAVLAAAGLVRSPRDGLRLLGLAFLAGWAVVGIGASFLLVAGTAATVYELLAVAGAVAGGALLAARRVSRFAPARTWRLSPAGAVAGAAAALLVAVQLGVLGWRSRLAHPTSWDAWAFWVPKAMALVYSGGLEQGPGTIESFANPDYPPFVPASDAAVFHFAGAVDPGLLALQHWLLAVALVWSLAGLLWHRVSPGLLLPPLAALTMLPVVDHDVGSLLGDEAVLTAIAVAGVAGGLWLLEREPRYLVLFALFGTVMALAKNEGFTYLVLTALLLAVASIRTGARLRAFAPLLLPLVAMGSWKLWTHVNDVPPNPYYRFGDLLDPGYLSARFDRLETTLRELPQFYYSFDRWLLTLPVVAVVLLTLVRRRPRLVIYVAVTIAVGFLGNVAVYWISPSPVDWYIETSGDRTSTAPIVFAAALLPLLLAEAFGATERPWLTRHRAGPAEAAHP